ncbi:hypothetical protein ACQKJC_18100 [Priestia koreensis]|uniref:hypothetical protein n=1 Tax=Priestia koreensis TaxID=284581 RepID=UPI003D0662B1
MRISTKLGLFFTSISAFLYATKHITAAIMVMNVNTATTNYYDGAYESIGIGITIWTVLSFILACGFFIHSLWTLSQKNSTKNSPTDLSS